NTKHPRTGLYKRLIDVETLFVRDVAGHLADAQYPNPAAMPSADRPVPQLANDWHEAEQETARAAAARTAARRDFDAADATAPRYLIDFLRFGVGEGERHGTA